MACPVCGKWYCDHTPVERGQTSEEMMDDLDREAKRAEFEGVVVPLNSVDFPQMVVELRGSSPRTEKIIHFPYGSLDGIPEGTSVRVEVHIINTSKEVLPASE